MSVFRKKPVEIEARQFVKGSTPGHGYEIASWCGGRFNTDVKPSDPSDVRYSISIPTLEGVMTASEGDWIIRGVNGEYYPCKPDIFEKTYEPVECGPAGVAPEPGADIPDEVVDAAWDAFDEYHESTRESFRAALAAADAKRAELEGQA